MSKKLFFLLFIALAFTACKKNAAKISGTIVNPAAGTYIYLDELKSNELKAVDSVKITSNGEFSFNKEVKQPSFYLLKKTNANFLTLLVEPGEKVNLKLQNDSLGIPISLEGSKGTLLMSEYNKTLRATIKKLTGLNAIYTQNADKPGLPELVASLDSMAQSYLNEINLYTKKYIDDNISSLVSLVALYQQVAPSVYIMNPSKDIKYFLKVDSAMFSMYPTYDPVVGLHEQVKEIAAKMKGSPSETNEEISGTLAAEITLPTPEGDTVKLSSTRGSVVLLDFWASWCGPCRKENPNLVSAFNKYHRRGFQIFQVSLDKTREAWMKGIEEDHLEKWIHVSDIQYWNSSVVPLYRIESIPTNYLLDKEGHIIASNLRGENLQIKLAELFK